MDFVEGNVYCGAESCDYWSINEYDESDGDCSGAFESSNVEIINECSVDSSVPVSWMFQCLGNLRYYIEYTSKDCSCSSYIEVWNPGYTNDSDTCNTFTCTDRRWIKL